MIDKAARTIDATATVDIALAFPVFASGPTRRVGARSGSVYSDKKIEVAMMLDITGSMAGQKIKDLKEAAKASVGAFLGGQDAADPGCASRWFPMPTRSTPARSSTPCLSRRRFTGGEPPASTDPVAVAAAGASFDGCATERKGAQQFTDAPPSVAMVNRDVRLGFCPASPMVPLTGDRKALDKVIDGFVAHKDAYTAGHIGIQWSWYALSPKWAGEMAAASAPGAYGDAKTAKFAILMTDGEFNTAFAGVPQTQQTKGGQPTRSRQYAEKLCAEMKAAGIEVFTVGFMLKNTGDAKKIMQGCASPDKGGVSTTTTRRTAGAEGGLHEHRRQYREARYHQVGRGADGATRKGRGGAGEEGVVVSGRERRPRLFWAGAKERAPRGSFRRRPSICVFSSMARVPAARQNRRRPRFMRSTGRLLPAKAIRPDPAHGNEITRHRITSFRLVGHGPMWATMRDRARPYAERGESRVKWPILRPGRASALP